jgi:hypothetical protein
LIKTVFQSEGQADITWIYLASRHKSLCLAGADLWLAVSVPAGLTMGGHGTRRSPDEGRRDGREERRRVGFPGAEPPVMKTVSLQVRPK